MKRLTLAAILCVLPAGAAARTPCKPSPPIDLVASLSGDPGGSFEVSARASTVLAADVELEVILPGGVTASSGSASSRARRPGLRLGARSPDGKRREVFVRATVRHGGAVMTRVVGLVLNDAPVPSPGVLTRNARGEAILEHRP